MWSFEGAELTTYFADNNGRGQTINLELSPLQIKTIFKALGINFNADGSYTAFGDKTLADILNRKINPFSLEELNERDQE